MISRVWEQVLLLRGGESLSPGASFQSNPEVIVRITAVCLPTLAYRKHRIYEVSE